MSRELDALMDKLTKINVEMGGQETREQKRGKNFDRFSELRIKMSERMHTLKLVSDIFYRRQLCMYIMLVVMEIEFK